MERGVIYADGVQRPVMGDQELWRACCGLTSYHRAEEQESRVVFVGNQLIQAAQAQQTRQVEFWADRKIWRRRF
jgi:hypothetical protein